MTLLRWSAATAASLYQRSNLGVSDVVGAISKRSTDDRAHNADAANTAWLVLVLLNIIIWVPVLFFLGYTLSTVLPVLAAVEDNDAPPSYEYEAVALKEDIDEKLSSDTKVAAVEESGRPQPRPVTSNIWATLRLLRTTGGGFFKGYRYALLASIAQGAVAAVVYSFCPFLPTMVAVIIADLATVQLSAMWVHAVISSPPASSSSRPSFWQRLPRFKTAFRATAVPTVIAGLAFLIPDAVGKPLYSAAGVKLSEHGFEIADASGPTALTVAKVLAVPFIQQLLFLSVALPASVVLFRCQASLLEEGAQTIVPLDRTFQLASVRERGYASAAEAWKTLSRASWGRIAMLYVKIAAVTVATEILFGVLVFVQALFVSGMLEKN